MRRGHVGQRRHVGARVAAQAAQLALLGAGLPVLAARRGGHRRRDRAVARDQALDLGRAEAPRQHAVDDDGVERAPDGARHALLEVERLRDRQLGRERDGDDRAARRVLQQRHHLARLRGDRPDAGDLGERVRGAQHADAVAARGAVEDDEVVAARALDPALAPAELPRLGDRHQLARARRGVDEGREGVGVREQPDEPARADLAPGPLLERHHRVDRRRPQPVLELHLAPGPAGVGAVELGGARLAGHLAEHDAAAVARGGQRRRQGDGRLAHAALAGDEGQLNVVEHAHPSPRGTT